MVLEKYFFFKEKPSQINKLTYMCVEDEKNNTHNTDDDLIS